MAKFIGSTGHTGLAIVPWILAFCGFGILLGGISAMQQACGGAGVNSTIPPGMGAVGYLSAVPCDRFFSFDWFILFWHFFVWVLAGILIFSRRVHTARSMITALLAIAATLLSAQANTWYRINGVGSGLNSTFKSRARTTFAGAIVAAVADIMLLIVLGLHDEYETGKEEGYPTGGYRTTPATPAAPPVTTQPVGSATAV